MIDKDSTGSMGYNDSYGFQSNEALQAVLSNLLDIAYQKLLDESYEDASLEISSDISALNVILAQEGLTRSPFDEAPERIEYADR